VSVKNLFWQRLEASVKFETFTARLKPRPFKTNFCTIFLSVFQHAKFDLIFFFENGGYYFASGAAGGCAHFS
jgi:hypothetical protein